MNRTIFILFSTLSVLAIVLGHIDSNVLAKLEELTNELNSSLSQECKIGISLTERSCTKELHDKFMSEVVKLMKDMRDAVKERVKR